MPAFLTDDWFATVDNLTAQAGELNLSPTLANLALNLIISATEGKTELALVGGKIQKGLADSANTTLNMDAETLRKVFFELDMTAAMQAFMTGKIKVEGDISQLMALQMTSFSAEHKNLLKKVLEQTV